MFENDEEENTLQPQDAVVPQTQEDPDADVKRKLAYVAQYGDREDERKMAQNASNWLASNSTSSFQGDGAEKFRAFADQMYRGTKERTNDWTKDERKQRYDERFALAKDLTDKLNFVIEKNGDKEQFAEETRQAQNALSFLTNHTSKFDNWSSDNVNGFANRVNEMYDAAEKRRGHLEVFADALKRGYFSTATMVAQGGMMLKPGELTDDDLQTIRALQENQNRIETAEMPHRTSDLRDIHSAGDVVDFISEAVGDNAYRTGIAVAGSMLGAGVAGVAGLGSAGTTAASIAGASAAGMAMNTGEAVGDQLDDGMTDAKNFSRALALGQGLGYSVVDGAFGVEQLLGKVGTGILKSIGRGTAKTGATVLRDIAANASWKTAAKNVAKSAIGEGIQEPSQSTISDVRRQYQTGKMLRTGETWEDYFWGKASEGAGAAAAALVTGGLASGLSVAGARRRVETTRRFADKLMQNPVYNNLSREHQILVGRHLINDSLLATDRYSTVLSDEDRASLQAQNAAIESDLASDEADGAENARKVLASITSDYALEDKATIADEARKNGTLRQIDAASLRETEREVRFDGQGENERVFSYYDKNTNQHLYRVTDGKDEVWMVAPPEGMKPAIDGETTFATLGEALNAMAENDAYNRARAENSKSKREVIKKAVNNIYGGDVNLVLADGVGGISDDALRQKFERGGSDAKAGYDADTNTLVVMTDNINSLGELYTTLAHESKHREIADYILGRGENLKEGKARLFGGKANAGAEQFAQRHGIGLEEANEEMAVENASVEDVVKALRDSDSNLMSAAVRKVFDFVRQKMGADMSLTSGVISDADVRRELSFLYASGYLGKTKTAPVKINLVGDDYENDVQQGLQARRINDSLVTNPAPVEETAEEAAPAPETAPETPVEPIVEEMPAPETPSAAKVPKAKSSPAKAKASTAPTTKTVADGIETNLAEVQAAINDLAANVANMNDSKRVKAYEDGMKNAQRRFEKMSDDELKATIADLKVRDKNTATDAAHALLGIAYDVQNERNSAKPSTTPENAPVSAMSENGEQSTASAQNAPEAASDANTEANEESTTKPENKETKDEAGNVPDEEQAQPEPPSQGGQEAAEEGSPAEVVPQTSENAPTSASGATDAQSTVPTSEGKEAAPEAARDVRQEYLDISPSAPRDRMYIANNATNEELASLVASRKNGIDAFVAAEDKILAELKKREAEKFSPEYAAWLSKYKLEDTPTRRKEWEAKQKDAQKAKEEAKPQAPAHPAPKAVKQETAQTAPEAQVGAAAKPEKPAKPVLRTKGAKPPKSLQERADKAKKVLKPEIAKMSTTDLQRLAKVWRKQGDEHALALADAADALVELRNWEAKNTLKGAADEEQKMLDKFIESEAPRGILAFMQENGPIMAKPERKRVTDWRGNVSWQYDDQTAGDALDNFFNGMSESERKVWSNRIFGKGASSADYDDAWSKGDNATDALREWFNDDNLTIDDALDMLVKEHEAFEKFKARGGKTFEEIHDEEMAAREVKIDGDSYDIVDLDNNEIEREVYDNAFAEVMQTPNAVEQFSRGELNKLREGDILRFDHAETSWTVRSFDDAKGELIVSPYVDEKDELFKVFFPTKEQQEAVLDDRTTFRITENGWEKLQEKENENGNQPETGKGTHETVDRDAQGERGGKGGEALVLESATPAELKSEERKRKQKAEIAKRQAAPLKGGVGQVGQSLLDLGGAEGEDLFNRTQRAQAPAHPAAPTRAEAVAEMKLLGMDSALDDAHLRAKMREWERHADDPRFAARLKAANTLLADRAAKGKAELTDEDKARKALGISFKRGENAKRAQREYDEVVARYTNADGTKKRGWMLAPNGKPTNLTERQWVQVRTPSFKRWFGDWEALAELYAARDFALNGEPVAEVSGEDFQKDQTGANTLIDRVADYFAKIGGKAESPDLGTVELTREGAKSSVAHGIGSRKAAAFAAVKEVIEKGVVFDRNDNWKGRGYATAAIAAPIRMGGKDYVCELIVNRYKDRNAFYLHEVNLKEKLSDTIKTATGAVSIGESARPVMSIIAQRLAEVNPASVSKVVDENGEPKPVFHGTNADFTTFDIDGVGGGAAYFTSDKDYAKAHYGQDALECFLNVRKPLSQEEAYDKYGVDFSELNEQEIDKTRRAVDRIKADGYDGVSGVTFDNDSNEKDAIAVFSPNQIKSATDNTGAFDAGDDDIRFKRSGLYTGSAADYEKPSLHAVGTGEGSQVYGWGLYASNVRGVAETYAVRPEKFLERNGERIYKPDFTKIEGIAERVLLWNNGNVENAIAQLKGKQQDYESQGKNVGAIRSKTAIEYLRKHGHEYKVSSPVPHIYEQTFFTNRAPGDESHLLKWHEPVDRRSWMAFRKAAKDLGVELVNRELPNGTKYRTVITREGKESGIRLLGKSLADMEYQGVLYQLLAEATSPKEASEAFVRAGIDGVKYPVDSYGSKGVQDGDKVGWNYVSFRDDNISVDHKWVNGEMLFKRSSPVERRKDLVAVHNIGKDRIRDIVALGGFAMPSIAVVKDSQGHGEYGDVSVLFGREAIDPKRNRRNAIFSHDAWTPTFPEIAVKVDTDKVRAVSERLFETVPPDVKEALGFSPRSYSFADADGINRQFSRWGYTAADAYGSEDVIKAAYLISKGEKVEVKENSFETAKSIYGRVDANDPDYRAWVNEQYGDVVLSRGIRNSTDWYTPSGKKRDWDALYDPVTLENVVKAMRDKQHEQGNGFLGRNPYGVTAKKYASIDALIRDEGKLKNLTKEEAQSAKTILSDEFSACVAKYADTQVSPDENTFTALGQAEDAIYDAWENSRGNIEVFDEELNTWGYSANEDLAKRIYDVLHAMSEMDTRYFEAKPQRAVDLKEARAWVVPESTDAADRKSLEDRGQKVYTYKDGDEADRLRVVNEVANEQTDIRFKRGANEDGSTLPFATEDDPDVAFGTKDGIFQKTGIEREFERVGDVGVMKEGAQRARDVSDVNDIIGKVNRGDAPSSSDLATLIHAYADRLAALDKLRRTMTDGSRSEELENLEKAVENIVDGLRRAGNRSGHALQMLKIGVSLTGMRDTYHYLASEVKAIKAQQGLNPELTDAERKMVEAQTAQLKEVNDKLQAELAKRDERIEDLEAVNKQLMELRRSISRKINKAITEKYGIQHEDTVNSAFARIGKRFSRTPGAVMKRGESASVALDDELRAGFAEALYGVGMNEGNARRLIADNFGNEAASLFDEYLKELGATKETRVAKSEERREAARPAPADAAIVRQKSRLDILRVATVANLDALGAEATDDAKHRAMAKYLRDFMKYTAKANPSMSSEEVLAKMAEEAKALDPNGTYDAASMLSVATGKRGYDVETRTAVGKRVAELEKALALAKQGKFTEAAKLAGIAYENDAQVLERYEKELRERLAEKSDRLVELMENPPEDSAAKVEEIKSLQDEIKQTAEAIANLRKEGTLAEKRAKIVEALKQKLAAKEQELAELEGKPVDPTDLKEEAQRLRKKLNTLTREHNFIKTLRDQIAEYERRIEENDFETPLTPPRQKPERSAEVQRLIAERDRMRKRFKNARHAHQYKQLGLPAQLLKDAWQILGESKALKGSLDLSSMFRQGGQLTFAHPILWARNFRKMIDALKSEENAQRLMAEIMSRPNAKYYEQAGIDFTDWGVGATNADDRFAKYDSDTEGRFLLSAFRKFSRAKLIRLGVGASERAFSMYLNLMRADVFDAMVNGSTYGGAANMTERQLKAVGKYLNIASQRASFDKGSATAKAVDFLNTILWSPRNVISRFQFLWETAKLANPWANPYGDKTMRGLFAKELGRYLLGMGAMVMFAKTLADLMRDDDEPEEDIELDPRSSQFMCVKFGESRVDFMSGLKQVLTFLSRGVTRQSKNSRGQLREINVSDLLGSFLQTKFSPAASFVRDFVTGETFNRQDIVWDSLWTNTKDEKSAYRHLVETIVPLTFTDVIEQVEYSGWDNAVVTSMATILGAGVNTYDPKTYKQLKNDFAYYRNLYAEADADSREELLRKHPMLRNQAAIEAAIKRVKEVEKFARNIEKHGGDPSTLQNTIEERRQKVIDLIAGGTSNR